MKKSNSEQFSETSGILESYDSVKAMLKFYFSENEIANACVLDAGCRIGSYTKAFHEMGAAKVTGIDINEELINTARLRFSGNSDISFYVSDISLKLPFDSNSFDLVFCSGTMVYLSDDDMKKAFYEFVRVTKNNGIILVLFQKPKSFVFRFAIKLINVIPFSVYSVFCSCTAFLFPIVVRFLYKRRMTTAMAKYMLLGMRNLNCNMPVSELSDYLVPTPDLEQCSSKTTQSFKFRVTKMH